jgi:hypothetical protein
MPVSSLYFGFEDSDFCITVLNFYLLLPNRLQLSSKATRSWLVDVLQLFHISLLVKVLKLHRDNSTFIEVLY